MRRILPLSLVFVLMCSLADASPVTVQTFFTSFTSTLEPPNSLPLHTYVNGFEVAPVTSVPFTVPLASTEVDFWLEQFSGVQTHNRVWFEPGPAADVNAGQEFLFGRFHFVNGVWFGDADIAFTMVSNSTDPALHNHQLTNIWHMRLNPFVAGDPIAGADYFHLENPGITCSGPSLPIPISCRSARVYELFDSPILPRQDLVSNHGSVELWGRIGSLIITDFRNPEGALFVSGSITSDPNPILLAPPVPEPSSLLLLAAALTGCVYRARRRRMR
jgi:hypothetical protein